MLKEEAIKFFKELLCHTSVGRIFGLGSIKDTLGVEESLDLVKHVTKDEDHGALMNMKSYKALGPDRFQPIFFQMFWNEVGDDV